MKYLLMGFIRLYQMTFSRVLPASCRFTPSCSAYGYEAVSKYGALKGGWLALKKHSLTGMTGQAVDSILTQIIASITAADLTLIGLMLAPTAAIFASLLLSISILAQASLILSESSLIERIACCTTLPPSSA